MMLFNRSQKAVCRIKGCAVLVTEKDKAGVCMKCCTECKIDVLEHLCSVGWPHAMEAYTAVTLL